MDKKTKEEINVIQMYKKDCVSNLETFLTENTIKPSGILEEEATQKLHTYGLNEISQNKPKKWYHYFLESLLSPFNCILLGICVILFFTDVYLPEIPSYANISIILILVFLSAFLDFFEEYRSNKAAEKLKEMVSTTSIVIRNGKKVNIPMKQIVLGDTICLSAGDIIPADVRVIESTDLYISQSTLTGESDAIKKSVENEIPENEILSITDFKNICFMGTNVISGSGKAVVIKTADDTYLSKIAHTLTEKPKSAFQKNIEKISKLLIRFMIFLIPFVFILNLEKHGLLTAFTFSVAVAIGITPLLLPVILSSSLSKGAIKMSKKKTIVKKLDSVQSFGSMNILCTDKTGTLTEDKIVLEKYLDIKGDEDLRILKHAFLNSYFQSGLKSNIDEAVIARALNNNMEEYTTKYQKLDEIPFDFSRRRLSVIVSDGTKQQLITKGAVEEILNISTLVDYKGKVSPLTNEIKENIKKISKKLNQDGLRVVAVCQKNDISNIEKFSVQDEKNMILLGFIGFLDPPKETAKIAIEKLNHSGIRVIVLTGDNAEVTKCICDKVGINSERIVLGNQVEKLNDMAVLHLLRDTNIFAKLSPIQKARIVRLLKESGNVVGYMGDGINDSPSLTNADVSISVDTAVDIAKESADIILLEKDLNVLIDGVVEGRKTFSNLMKYIKLATSFNFGEVLSVIIASVFLPFLPETPIQLLFESLLYDFGQLTLPLDNVDKEYIKQPKKLDINSLKKFMLFMGPISSIFDVVIFASLWFIFGVREAALFQTIWFTYTIISNLVGMHIIRTPKIPFVQSNASWMVYFSSIALCFVALIFPSTALGKSLGLVTISFEYIGLIFSITILYCVLAMIAKHIFIKKNKEWI